MFHGVYFNNSFCDKNWLDFTVSIFGTICMSMSKHRKLHIYNFIVIIFYIKTKHKKVHV